MTGARVQSGTRLGQSLERLTNNGNASFYGETTHDGVYYQVNIDPIDDARRPNVIFKLRLVAETGHVHKFSVNRFGRIESQETLLGGLNVGRELQMDPLPVLETL